MEPSLFIRPFTDQDYVEFVQWRAERGLESPHRSWLPETSFVCYRQDHETHEQRNVGCISLYMDASCGICHVDWLTTRPRLPLNEAHETAGALLDVCSKVAQNSFPDTAVMIGCVQSPAMANAVRKHGFTPTEQVTMILKEIEPWQPQSQSYHSSPPQ